jgi:intracellular sulfur oxidation DsrE/DsrF family protein
MDNPSLKLVRELEKIGARFIACGQALDFMGLEKKDLLPAVKVSFTAQTALTSYQLKGYVLKSFPNGDK